MRPIGFYSALLLIGTLAFMVTGASADERPTVAALRLPDGAITIDGRDSDWQNAGQAFIWVMLDANSPRSLLGGSAERGVYLGPSDCSLEAWLAVDSANLYVLANVHDQLLFNDVLPENIFDGDDFEVFIDANAAEGRFAKTKNENFRQLIFLPANINPNIVGNFIWQADKTPGVAMASRLRPWGYTIEIKIPKALFPNWKAHPEMDTFGFDIQVNDADSPGLDGMHPSLKTSCFLLKPDFHFMGPETLGKVEVNAEKTAIDGDAFGRIIPPTPAQTLEAIKSVTAQNADTVAQNILDSLSSQQAGEIASAAIASKERAVQKAGLELLAKCPKVVAPVEAIQAAVTPMVGSYGAFGDAELVSYSLVALAERGKMPVEPWFGFYTRIPDPMVRLTFIWCLGTNGDRAAVPYLMKLLYDGNLRVRIKAAMALGALGDKAAVPALEEMAKNDPHHYGRVEAENALKRLKS